MQITFDMSEIHKMAARYESGTQVVREEVRKGMTDTVIAIEADAKRRVATDTHALQRSITHEVVDSGGAIIGRAGTNKTVEGGLSHGEIIENGRRPGKMPPKGSLLPWMRRHGIDASAEYLIRRAVNRGKYPRPFLKPAYDINRLKITREFGSAVPKRILERLAGPHG